MTRADVVQRLWDFINSAPAKNGAGATIINAEARSILEACNAAIQEIAHYAPRDFFKQTRSALLRAPISATVDVTEDSKDFTKLRLVSTIGIGSSNTSSTLSSSNHGLAVGDKIRFNELGIPPVISAGVTYHVVSVPDANSFRIALTSDGSAIAMNASDSFAGHKVIDPLPEGCSIELQGSDELMRINTCKYDVEAASVSVAVYSGTSKTVFLDDTDDPESWQSTLKVGDTVAFVDAVPASSPSLTVGTSYFVTQITSLDGIGSTSGADTYRRYIRLGTSAGNSDINITASSGTFSMVKTSSLDNGYVTGAQGTFHEEYMGTSGTKTCTVYYDAVELNSKVTEVLGTVVLNDESVLTPLMNNDQSSRMHRDRLDQSERFGEYGSGWELPSELQDKKGTPSYYYIDAEHNEVTNGQNYYLRVRPFPEKKARLRFTASILPEKWVIQDTYSNTGQAKDTGCPADYDETILLPFVYKNFVKFIGFDVLPSEGSLQSGNILLQIDEDYKQAKEILKELQPQSESQPVYGVAW
tara:strand:- start:7 stop:1590 length:1584 start_codon:yes stop_codon:yes gene_type:complete